MKWSNLELRGRNPCLSNVKTVGPPVFWKLSYICAHEDPADTSTRAIISKSHHQTYIWWYVAFPSLCNRYDIASQNGPGYVSSKVDGDGSMVIIFFHRSMTCLAIIAILPSAIINAIITLHLLPRIGSSKVVELATPNYLCREDRLVIFKVQKGVIDRHSFTIYEVIQNNNNWQ